MHFGYLISIQTIICCFSSLILSSLYSNCRGVRVEINMMSSNRKNDKHDELHSKPFRQNTIDKRSFNCTEPGANHSKVVSLPSSLSLPDDNNAARRHSTIVFLFLCLPTPSRCFKISLTTSCTVVALRTLCAIVVATKTTAELRAQFALWLYVFPFKLVTHLL